MVDETPLDYVPPTPEERERDRQRVAAELERLRVKDERNGGPPAAPIARERAPGSLEDTLRRFKDLAVRETGKTVEELEAEAEKDLAAPIVMPVDPRAVARRRAEEALAPELHIENVLDGDPEECDALTFAREAMSHRPGGFFVMGGGKGTRKTGSAVWALGQRDGGVYVDANDLLDVAFNDRPLMLRLKRARLVVLDDLGGENLGEGRDREAMKRIVEQLYNRWYGNKATVIITGNITREQLHDYGSDIEERMRERGRFKTIGGESVRRAKRDHWIEDKE